MYFFKAEVVYCVSSMHRPCKLTGWSLCDVFSCDWWVRWS